MNLPDIKKTTSKLKGWSSGGSKQKLNLTKDKSNHTNIADLSKLEEERILYCKSVICPNAVPPLPSEDWFKPAGQLPGATAESVHWS